MNSRNFKTALIIALVIGAILQAGKLWFEESSGHNFFSSFTNRRPGTSGQYMIEPKTIMVSAGGTRYLKAGEGDEIKAAADSCVLQLVKSGRYVGTTADNWLSLLSSQSIIYIYPVTISTESFARSCGESGGDFTSKTEAFDTLVIRPARTASEYMRIYVVDSMSGEAHVYETQRGVSETVSREMTRLAQIGGGSETGLLYISSEQNSLDFFTGNVFLPQWQEQAYTYLMPYVTNPFEEEDFESCALPFFDSPVGVLSAEDPAGVPFLSGKESVVKYYNDTETLEYTNYAQVKNPRTTLNAAYTAAISFMERDPTLANGVTMTDARLNEGEWTLYFDYVWGGARIFTGEEHAVEIAISGDTVIKYRRIVKRISTSDLMGQTNISFLSALDHVLAERGAEVKLDGLELAYDVSENGICGLEWFIETRGALSAAYER